MSLLSMTRPPTLSSIGQKTVSLLSHRSHWLRREVCLSLGWGGLEEEESNSTGAAPPVGPRSTL